MKLNQIKIIDSKLILPKKLRRILKWKFPFYQIPKLDEFSREIQEFSKVKNRLPFYLKFDINNDGHEEIIIMQKSIIGGFGRLLIISEKEGKLKFKRIKWNRPVNSLYFDYLIDISKPKKYQTFGLIGFEDDKSLPDSMKSKNVVANFSHVITKGYLTRIVYWDGEKYCQEKISGFDNS